MGKFKAYTHYGDWKGTVAADEAHPESVHELLKKMGLIRKDEFLLSVSISQVDGSVLVSAFVLEGMGELGQVEEYLESHNARDRLPRSDSAEFRQSIGIAKGNIGGRAIPLDGKIPSLEHAVGVHGVSHKRHITDQSAGIHARPQSVKCHIS